MAGNLPCHGVPFSPVYSYLDQYQLSAAHHAGVYSSFIMPVAPCADLSSSHADLFSSHADIFSSHANFFWSHADFSSSYADSFPQTELSELQAREHDLREGRLASSSRRQALLEAVEQVGGAWHCVIKVYVRFNCAALCEIDIHAVPYRTCGPGCTAPIAPHNCYELYLLGVTCTTARTPQMLASL